MVLLLRGGGLLLRFKHYLHAYASIWLNSQVSIHPTKNWKYLHAYASIWLNSEVSINPAKNFLHLHAHASAQKTKRTFIHLTKNPLQLPAYALVWPNSQTSVDSKKNRPASEQAASLPLFAGQRLRAMSANGGIRAKNQKLSATFHAQNTCSIGGIASESSLSAKLSEEEFDSRRSPASKVLTPPCTTVCSYEALGQKSAI